jgi:predicted TIM-barrel fold metal-dependent hydrolase
MDFKIIDAHFHFSAVEAFRAAAADAAVDFSPGGYGKECEEAGIGAGICMGATETAPFSFPDNNAPTPMEAERPNACLGINPHTLDEDAVKRLGERVKNDPSVAGFKIYAGYYHYFVHDPVYAPVYEIAAEHDLTVAIHTGVTYSERGILEYSHPLTADRLAVQYRDTRFLLCHMGNPWIMDACEIAYKNRNVYLDISGLVEGDAAQIAFTEGQPLLMQHYTTGLVYLNNYKKVLFGTNWPIVPMKAYVDCCKKIIPPQAREDVFRQNAINVYKLSDV